MSDDICSSIPSCRRQALMMGKQVDRSGKWEQAMALLEIKRARAAREAVPAAKRAAKKAAAKPPAPWAKREPPQKAAPKYVTIGVQRQRAAEAKRRAETRALERQEAHDALVARRLRAQRLLDSVRRLSATPQDTTTWWTKFTPEDRLLIAEEFLHRAGTGEPEQRSRDLSRQLWKELAKGAHIWRRSHNGAVFPSDVVDDRLVPGLGLKTVPFTQVPWRYLDRRTERFWPYVDQSGGPQACWPWHGPERYDSGYGHFCWRGQLNPAHRVSWMLNSGLELPYDLVVDHLCCCRWCVNPDHLEPVTRGENNRRTHRRRPEETRIRTSFESPFADRWYPFGRRLYDAAGNRLVPRE